MITKRIAGELIAYTTKDHITQYGFLTKSRPNNNKIIIHEPGMCSNFFAGAISNDYMNYLKGTEYDFFSTNNRGFGLITKFYEKDKKILLGTAHEKFEECIFDIDGAILAATKLGYKEIILSGQSTGCQKIIYYQSKKKNKKVKALILLAPADDYNLTIKQLGKKFHKAVSIANNMVKQGKGSELAPTWISKYSAKRFLSIANPKQTEAEVLNYTGKLKTFAKVTIPIIAIVGTEEEYASNKTPKEMLEILSLKTNSTNFEAQLIEGANHGFSGKEKITLTKILQFLKALD